jgi:hypothetical protein
MGVVIEYSIEAIKRANLPVESLLAFYYKASFKM